MQTCYVFRPLKCCSAYPCICKRYSDPSALVDWVALAGRGQMAQYGSIGVCEARQQGKQARRRLRSSLLNRKLMMGVAPA